MPLQLLLVFTLSAAPRSVEAFSQSCVERGGDYVGPHVSYGIGRIEVPPKCGFERAPDANRSCSNSDPEDCKKCSLSASCQPAAGDFGPMECHCGSWARIEVFEAPRPFRGVVDVSTVKTPKGFRADAIQAVAQANKAQLELCMERAQVAEKKSFTLALTLDVNGRVTDAKADDACVMNMSRRWVFPKPPKAGVVTIPFSFTPQPT